jgi:hypothetical protein
MSITNLSSFTPESEIDPAMISEKELEIALSQYVKKPRSYDSGNITPITLTANSWQPIGSAYQFGELGKGTFWDIMIYFQYPDPGGGINQPYFQYCGGASLCAIYWQADFLTNEGVLAVPVETHNEADFTARIRFGQGNGLRRVEANLSRGVTIGTGGFCRVTGSQRL